ncbi:MAG: tRNA lysidine(34) synthetase TilS [Chloroflexi bacterium]|nr:tRNA lysidine(34) synthetase TilS [Chloroflexota bacterium]
MSRRSRRYRGFRESFPRPSPVIRMHFQVLESARRLDLLPTDTVVVGVSGGPDSTALLDMLGRIQQTLRIRFQRHAAHLIHDFRGQEKYDDAQFVRDLCADRGLELTVEEVDVASYQRERGVSSFEQAARDLRYQFLERVARETGARFVAVAHTADDLAETILLHIARGSGMHGLRGMTEISPWPYPGVDPAPRLWRPLLGVRRADTIAYSAMPHAGYRDDSTNYMEDFARNRVRMNLMPALAEQLNPRIVHALGRLARTAATQLDFLEACTEEHWPAVAPEGVDANGMLRLRRGRLTDLHPALQALLLRRAWTSVTGDSKRLTEGHLQHMAHIARGNASGKTVMLPGSYTARADGEWLKIQPAEIPDDCPYPDWPGDFRITLPWGPIAVGVTRRGGWEVTAETAKLLPGASLDTGDPMQAYLSPSALAEGATVRTWQPGDRMQPLGMPGRRKLQDLFADAGLPRNWRDRIPLVVTPEGIAWAVGLRLANWAGVQRDENGESEAVRLTFQIVYN